MKIPQTSNYTLSVFNENILPKLSPLQKKIGILALMAFGLIAAYYAYCRWLKPKAAGANVEANSKEVAKADIQAKQEQAIETIKYQLDKTLSPHFLNIQSGMCVVKCDFENGSIKQQYLFKNEDGSPVALDWTAEIDKIAKSIKQDLQPDLGIYKKFEWFFLVKSENNNFYEIHGNHRQSSTLSTSESGGGNGSSQGKDAIIVTIMNLKDMGIPKESVIKDGEFIPGEFYKDLNAPLPVAVATPKEDATAELSSKQKQTTPVAANPEAAQTEVGKNDFLTKTMKIQIQAFDKMKAQMENTLPLTFQNFQSGVCFVNSEFENGTFKRQFIFKNEDGSPVTIDLAAQIHNIRIGMTCYLTDKLGLPKTFDWFFLIKKDTEEFDLVYGNQNHASKPTPFESSQNSGSRKGEKAIQFGELMLEDMDIPREMIMKDGEFLPTELDKPVWPY